MFLEKRARNENKFWQVYVIIYNKSPIIFPSYFQSENITDWRDLPRKVVEK